ncbi:unnamed protein product [Closterium sp. Naga37s-1]|nr:unnamed protein product [Closterium sp. Naga37s-1]
MAVLGAVVCGAAQEKYLVRHSAFPLTPSAASLARGSQGWGRTGERKGGGEGEQREEVKGVWAGEGVEDRVGGGRWESTGGWEGGVSKGEERYCPDPLPSPLLDLPVHQYPHTMHGME